MKIITITHPNNMQKQAIYSLWNNEYPGQLQYTDISELDNYLNNLKNATHYFAVNENRIAGWAFTFERDNEKWFAIIVSREWQGNGIGNELLNCLKRDNNILNGWATDHNNYIKNDGTQYLSPMQFYIKNAFTVCEGSRLEIEKLSAVKISWKIGNS